ncbi:MAG TPA: hypothetical protein G4O03_03635 [Dehalococcoidia bacterium]|nr:hypothetical protein [Dehalococcoidia bacterium]
MKHRLRPYQIEVARAILDSVLHRRGLTFSVEIARQGGKNELSAQLEVLLLTLFMGIGGNGIKCSPTFKPQTVISMQRLKERLNDAGYNGLWRPELGYMVRLGRARQVFLSAEESSHVVGATAHILLEVDESQDVSKEKYTKEFRPMGSATNVTTVHYGTAWDDRSLLEEVKQTNLELERRDGLRRHFQFDWQEVAKYNPDYLRFVEGERARLGESHPLFQTQYCLRPLSGGGGFLSAQQRAQLQGSHHRRPQPLPGESYVAGVDVAGQAEEAQDAPLRALKPRQDSTVVTIGRLDFSRCSTLLPEPGIQVVEHYWWTGRPHAELYPQLVDVLKHVWGCRRVVVDSTGLGEGVASFLTRALGSSVVVPFQFTQPSKSRLGFELVAAVNSGRLKMYAPDDSAEYREFWEQISRSQSYFRANQTMNFFVDPAQGHDDFVMSLALLVEAARYQPRFARGRARGISHEGVYAG